MTSERALLQVVDAALSRLPSSHVAHRQGPRSWNLVATAPEPGELSLGWDLSVDLARGRVELTHSNDWRVPPEIRLAKLDEPSELDGTLEEDTPVNLTASYLALAELEREGALLAFVLDVVRRYPPNTDCPT